jgi:tetratricopeptide (TPR) repeat protein
VWRRRKPENRSASRAAAIAAVAVIAMAATPVLGDPVVDCNEAREPAVRIHGCSRILEGDPPQDVRAIALMNRAIGFIAEGKREAALLDLEAALEAEPALHAARYNRGTLYLELGRTREAIEDFGAVIEAHPDFALAWLNRGLAREQAGNRSGAAADFARALQLDRTLAAARRGLERVKRRG